MKFVGNTELLIFKKQLYISSKIWIEAQISPLDLPYLITHKCDMLQLPLKPFCYKLTAEPLGKGHGWVEKYLLGTWKISGSVSSISS